MRYFLRKPSGKHASFRVTLRGVRDETIKNATLDSINAAYALGKLDKDSAEKSCKDLVAQLNKAISVHTAIFSKENAGLLERYWSSVYARKRLVDKATAKSALTRALTCLGTLSLASASYEDLQKAVDAYHGNKQRRLAQSLNQLLRFVGRDFTLTLARPVRYKVKYLNEAQFEQVLACLPNEAIKLLHQVAFMTGARIGECFAIEANCILQDTVRIDEQLDKRGQLRDTKNRKQRFAYIESAASPILKRWLLVKGSIDLATRRGMSKVTRRACKLAKLPPDKWICFHDLRHSYAIGLVSQGVSITAVAQCLGNGVAVCERYYVGHQLTTETVQMIKAILNKKG